MLSVAARLVVLALLAPVLYVVSALAWFPAVCWHAQVAPRASAVMGYRVAEASAAGQKLRLRHQWVPLERIPEALVQAVLVAEDTRFYEHRGFDFKQIRDAWRANRRGGRLRGASTISQQTAKNLYLDPSRNLLRKGREAILTAWLELWLPKERILEVYLNVVELGPGVFGADAAARIYFDREAGELTRAQAALLAATLPAPLSRNPAASTPSLRARQRMILSRMGRWYEGPSLAEEEAIAEQPHAPERRPSEPIGLEAMEDSAQAAPVLADTLPLDSGAVRGEDRAPAEDVPSPAPADSATESS
jgi:monofunctional biosynthetic peptidoglycan transglycosylase